MDKDKDKEKQQPPEFTTSIEEDMDEELEDAFQETEVEKKITKATPDELRKRAEEADKPRTTWHKIGKALDDKGLRPFKNVELLVVFTYGMLFAHAMNKLETGDLQGCALWGVFSAIALISTMFLPKSKLSQVMQRAVLEYLERNAPVIWQSLTGEKKKKGR